MWNKLARAYGESFMALGEDWGYDGAIKFHHAPEDRDGLPLFDYWQEDYREVLYTMGQRNHFYRFLERNGWYFEWINSEEATIAPI